MYYFRSWFQKPPCSPVWTGHSRWIWCNPLLHQDVQCHHMLGWIPKLNQMSDIGFCHAKFQKKNALCVKLFGDDLFELCSKHWSPTAQGGLRTLSPRRRRAFSRSFHWMGQCDWRGRRFESTWAKWHICLVLLKACRDTSLQILVYIYIYIYTIYLYIHGKSLDKHGCWCDKNPFQWYDAT